jgi:hypothetical protein
MPYCKPVAKRGKPGSELSKVPLRRDIRWRPKFLQELLKTEGNVTEASQRAGITTTIAYLARKDDPDFEQDWNDVREIIDEIRADKIEEATADRAVNGSKYTKYSPKGDVIEEGTVPDTSAAVAMLKAYRPARFKERPTADDTGNLINSFTALVKAVGDASRARAALQTSAVPPAEGPQETPVPVIEVEARPALPSGTDPPPLIRPAVN